VAPGYLRDLLRMFSRVLKTEQWKRGRTAGPVAVDTVLKEYRCDVLIEGGRGSSVN